MRERQRLSDCPRRSARKNLWRHAEHAEQVVQVFQRHRQGAEPRLGRVWEAAGSGEAYRESQEALGAMALERA